MVILDDNFVQVLSLIGDMMIIKNIKMYLMKVNTSHSSQMESHV